MSTPTKIVCLDRRWTQPSIKVLDSDTLPLLLWVNCTKMCFPLLCQFCRLVGDDESHLAIKEKKEKLDKNKGIFQFCGGCFAAQNYMKTNVVYMFFFFTHILIIKHNILLSSKKSPNLFSHIHMKQAEELPGELFPRGCRSVCHVW